MRDLGELNINEGGKPVDRPPPNDDEIARFQQAFGITIPREYLTLLRHSNGGYSELNTFGSEHEWSMGGGFFYLAEERDPESLWEAMRFYRQYLEPTALPFAVDGNGGVFILDVVTVPATVCLARRVSVDEIGITMVAESFGAFIDGLHIHPDLI